MCDLVSEGKVVNPFRETCRLGLMTLDTGEVMDPETALSKHRQNQVFWIYGEQNRKGHQAFAWCNPKIQPVHLYQQITYRSEDRHRQVGVFWSKHSPHHKKNVYASTSTSQRRCRWFFQIRESEGTSITVGSREALVGNRVWYPGLSSRDGWSRAQSSS